MLAASAFRLCTHTGTVVEMADVLEGVHRFQIVEVRPVSVNSVLLGVADPVLIYLVVGVESHSINEEVTAMMV